MILNSQRRLAILSLAAGMFCIARGAIIYNEAVSGDLSNSGLAPTPVAVSLGSNQILGTTGRTGTVVDRDYFTFTIPFGMELMSIVELAGTTTGGPVSFIGLQAGNQVTLPTDATTATGLLGWWHYSTADINTDILSKMAIPVNGSSGFTPPLPAGTYAVWIQDFAAGTFDYGFDLHVTTTPEPRTAGTTLVALAALAFAFRRRLRC
jgi:hypothetical protein